MSNMRGVYVTVFISLVILSSCRKDTVEVRPDIPSADQLDPTIALEWNQLFLNIERFTNGYRPPVSARTSAYIGLTAYQAILLGMPSYYNSMAKVLDGLSIVEPDPGLEYDWEAVLLGAYEASFNYYFPSAPTAQQYKIYELSQSQKTRIEGKYSQEIFNRSYSYGQAVAHDVYQWSKTDHNGHEAFLKNFDPSYSPEASEGKWQPTYPDFSPALLPQWGFVRTFAAHNAISPAPLQYSEAPQSEIYLQAIQTLELVDAIKQDGMHDERWIAEFWSDDCPIITFTPSARWISIANQVIQNEQVSLDIAVYTFAKMGFALSDAGVRCWREKYRYNYLRPIDYIREVMGHSHWNTIMCPDGSGGYYTPNFPAYPSGHATFGAAAAEVLTDIYGHHYTMTDRSHEGRTEFLGMPRIFDSFFAMAEENAYSRIPIGVHFAMDSDAGLDLGKDIGLAVNALPWIK